MEEECYYHITLQADLETLTPLTIGSGERVRQEKDIKPQSKDGEEHHRVTENEIALCQDKNGGFYIPGSSLKGSARNVSEHLESPDNYAWIFGLAAHKQANTDITSQGGKVRFLNAYCATQGSPTSLTQTRTRNRIDPITGTVKSGHLFGNCGVKPGTVFTLNLQLDKATQQEIVQLITLVRSWGSSQYNLGRGGNNNFGAFKLRQLTVNGITKDTYQQWIDSTATEATCLSSLTQKLNINAGEQVLLIDDTPTICISLTPLSPIFVGSGKHEEYTQQRGDESHNCQVATLIRNAKNDVIIPATSFRGVIRHQGQKIINTLKQTFGSDAERKAEKLLEKLFGSENQASTIKITDFVAQNPEISHQRFIAIDRFTGGVKGGGENGSVAGALYSIEKCHTSRYVGEMKINPRLFSRDQFAELAMLLMILRDLLEGELLIGGLKGKGFGKTSASIIFSASSVSPKSDPITHWQEFIQYWNRASLPNIGELMDAFNQAYVRKEELPHE